MKTKIKPIIFLCIITIVLIIGIVLIFLENKKDRLENFYKILCDSKEYCFSIENDDTDYEYKLVISKKDNNFCIDMYGDEHTSTIKKDGNVYYVMHREQEYYSMYDNDDTDINIIENALSNINISKYSDGKEEINGKTYYYEEYQNILDFLMKLNVSDDSLVKTRFYFDRDNICYIKNIVGNTEELLKIKCDFKSDNTIFEIPSNYAEK